MKYTNKHNLPQGIYDAVIGDDYSIGDADYSISQLNSPPQMRRLIRLNTDKITVDVSDEIWKLLGSSVHYILEKSQGKPSEVIDLQQRIGKSLITLNEVITNISLEHFNLSTIRQDLIDIKTMLMNPSEVPYVNDIMTEKRLYMRLAGKIISGKPDVIRLSPKILIEDYKVTSVWKILKGDYEDWEFQLNMYNLLADMNGIEIGSMQVNAILKDWKKFELEQQRDPNYPENPIAVVPITKWSLIDATNILLQKLLDHELVKDLTNPVDLYSVRPCTNKEKWHGEDKFAVMKEGGVKASKVFDTEPEAWQYISGRTDAVYKVERRLGEDKRCEEFCLAKPFCTQYLAEHGNAVVVELPTAYVVDSLIPSEADQKDDMKSLLDGIAADSNTDLSPNQVPVQPASENEVDALLSAFHKSKKPDFDLDSFLAEGT